MNLTTRKHESKAQPEPKDQLRKRPAILSFGYARPELKRKHDALTNLGFNVKSISKLETIKTLIIQESEVFRLLLIGPLVPLRERSAILELYKKHCPRGTVILFYRGSISNAEGAAVLLSEERSPENLIDAIRVLEKRLSSPSHRLA